MIPILYQKTETSFNNNGVGFLRDTISCVATEERNGIYELSLEYPITGAFYSDITEGAIIKAKTNETSEPQLFRVYKSSKPIKGVVMFYAEHISYDLNGIPIMSITMNGTTPGAAMSAAFGAAALTHSFTAQSDISTLNNIKIVKPCSLRKLLGGQSGSVLDVWGGEFEFDNHIVKLHAHRGANTGIVIEYGKNLTDIKQERNIAECYTHLCPYAVKSIQETDSDGNITNTYEEVITLSERVIALVGGENIGHYKSLNMDFTQRFSQDETINEENLRGKANAYIANNSLGTPKVSITASFVQLWQTAGYENIAPLERVKLCDTVNVRFVALGVIASAKVIKTVYNTLAERYNSVELGDAKPNFANTVEKQNAAIESVSEKVSEQGGKWAEELNNAIINATNLITGQNGGYVVLNPPNNPQEILIMNTPYRETATKVWRWNSGGLGYSSTGYDGTYGLAITMDGGIVADFINTGTLSAINISAATITGGTITGATISGGTLNINNKFTVDENGNANIEGYVKATSGEIGGCSIINGVLTIESANITSLAVSKISGGENNEDITFSGNIVCPNITASGSITATQLTISTTAAHTAGLATSDDVPTNTSELVNDSGYQNTSGVVSIIDGRITADYIEALGITVAAANITGKLVIGQLPSTVAETSDIPQYTSQLVNNSGYQNTSGVVSIIDGRITADYIEALGITVAAANITGQLTAAQINANGISASDVNLSGTITANSGTIGGWAITPGTISANASSSSINLYANNTTHWLEMWNYSTQKGVSILRNGTIWANNVDITGTITAISGYIGGFAITADSISKKTTTSSQYFTTIDEITMSANGFLKSVNEIHERSGGLFARTQTIIDAGMIHITRSAAEMPANPPFIIFTLQGTTYNIYVDTATMTVKART